MSELRQYTVKKAPVTFLNHFVSCTLKFYFALGKNGIIYVAF